MWRFAGRKLVSLVAILPVITLLVFLMRVLVPGDPVEVMFMGQATDRATIERVRKELGWDRPILVQYMNSIVQNKVLFGSDFPVLTAERWMKDFDTLELKPEVRQKILLDNAKKLLNLE